MADRRWAARRGHAHVSIERIRLRLHAIAFETASVRRIDLRDPDGRALPAFRPGAHVDLKLNGGVARSYSLVGDPADASRYLLGVQRDPQSRGGSQHLCEAARVGDLIEVSRPINNFALVEGAAASLFIAGGIGITPLRAIVEQLAADPGDVTLVYRAAYARDVAFKDELATLAQQSGLQLHALIGPEIGDDRTDKLGVPALRDLVPDIAQRDVFVCGPPAMVDALRRRLALLGVPRRRVHFERFAY